MKDKSFCNELKRSPKKVIERELEIRCPDNLKIEVIEQTSDKWVIVIPQMENTASLSENDLANIAGGVYTLDTCGIKCKFY